MAHSGVDQWELSATVEMFSSEGGLLWLSE